MLNIFIGYIFVFFHLKINGFDLLPDFVGYALIYKGVCKYSADAANFVKAKPWIGGMAVISFFSYVGGWVDFNYGNSPVIILKLIIILISIYIEYLINIGIQEMERNMNMDFNSEKLLSIWKVQAILSVGCAALSFLPSGIAAIVVAVLIVAAITADIIYLVCLHRIHVLSV